MRGSYTGALVAVSAFIPIPVFAAFFTILLYLELSTLLQPAWIILLGLGCAIAVLLLTAFLFRPLATAEGGKLADYELIQGDLQVLESQLKVVQSKLPAEEVGQTTIAEIESDIRQIKETLKKPGLIWVMRTGYIRMWDRINKVKEAMIDVLPDELVIESAYHAILRLDGSDIAERRGFIQELKAAINTLTHLDRSQQSPAPVQMISVRQSLPQVAVTIRAGEVNHSSSSTAHCDSKQSARSKIRQIQCFLHQYRCERWDGLVRARNQLLGAALLASVFLYLLLDFAILKSVPTETMVYICVFYLLGAMIGLFDRLLNEVRPKDAEIAHKDDYGLTGARIMVTPLLSGLVAVVGVPLALVALQVVQGQSSLNGFPLQLQDCYNFFLHPQHLLLAAAFGYVPSSVLSLLKRQAHKIQGELISSSAGNSQEAAGRDGCPEKEAGPPKGDQGED